MIVYHSSCTTTELRLMCMPITMGFVSLFFVLILTAARMGLDDLEKSILREKFMYRIVCTDRVSANLSGVIIHSRA